MSGTLGPVAPFIRPVVIPPLTLKDVARSTLQNDRQQQTVHPAGSPAGNHLSTSDKILAGALVTGATTQVVGRTLSATRIVFAFPHAKAEGRLPLWAFELLVQKSTIDIVPPRGGYLGLWGKAFAASQALKGVGAIATIALAGSATIGALGKGGPAALENSTQGRTGVAATIASVATLGFMGEAAHHAQGRGGAAMFKNMFTDEMLGKWKVVGPSLAAWTFILANQMGYLDWLNKGETRGGGQIMHDAWDKTKALPGNTLHKVERFVGSTS